MFVSTSQISVMNKYWCQAKGTNTNQVTGAHTGQVTGAHPGQVTGAASINLPNCQVS